MVKRDSALPLPSRRVLKKYLRYDGRRLFWKIAPSPWHKQLVGKEAGCPNNGRRVVRIEGQVYKVHRVIFKMVTGKDPEWLVDHRNRNGLDNSWKNIRESTESQNQRNRHDNWRGQSRRMKKEEYAPW